MLRIALLLTLLLMACTQAGEESIPPCTAIEGSGIDPCEARGTSLRGTFAAGEPAALGDAPLAVSSASLGNGESISTIHIALRGTFIPATTRCTTGNPFRPADYMRDTLWGEGSPGYLCYIDIRVNEYYIGEGPPRLSVLVWRIEYGRPNEEARQRMERNIDERFAGAENVIFLGPSFDVGTEAWQLFGLWKVAHVGGRNVALHPMRDRWLAEKPQEAQAHMGVLEVSLIEFNRDIIDAHFDRVEAFGGRIGQAEDSPMLRTNAGDLRLYYQDVGAYAEGAPEQSQPPPACAGAAGGPENTELIQDCETS